MSAPAPARRPAAAPRGLKQRLLFGGVVIAVLLAMSALFWRTTPKVVWLHGSNKMVAVRGHHGHKAARGAEAAHTDASPGDNNGHQTADATSEIAKLGGGNATQASKKKKAGGKKPRKEVTIAPEDAVGNYATLHTNYGPIVWELHPEDAPLSVENFRKLVSSGFHNGSCVYRYEKGFVLQGGACGGRSSAMTVPLEYKRPNVKHSVALARSSSPHSGGSEYFINLRDNTDALGQKRKGGYAVFATVLSGIDTIAKMKKLAVKKRGHLVYFLEPPKVLRVTFSEELPASEDAVTDEPKH